MSVLPSDNRNVAIADTPDSPRSKGSLVAISFAVLAGIAMAGWFYLIAKGLWALFSWLLF